MNDLECGLNAPKKQAKENEQMFLRILFYCFHSLNKQTAMYAKIDSLERRTTDTSYCCFDFNDFCVVCSSIPSCECIRLFCLNFGSVWPISLSNATVCWVKCKMIDSVQAQHEAKWWTAKHVLVNTLVIGKKPISLIKFHFVNLLWFFFFFAFSNIFIFPCVFLLHILLRYLLSVLKFQIPNRVSPFRHVYNTKIDRYTNRFVVGFAYAMSCFAQTFRECKDCRFTYRHISNVENGLCWVNNRSDRFFFQTSSYYLTIKWWNIFIFS